MIDYYIVPLKSKCNTNCSFCNFYEIDKKIDEERHLEDLKKEIDSVVSKGIKSIGFNSFGSEPTTFKYFKELLEYCKEKDSEIETYVSTNGVNMSDNNYTKQFEGLIDHITLGIYASNDYEHSVITMNKESHLLKHKTIENCLKNSMKVNVVMLLMKPTIGSLSDMIKQILPYCSYKFFKREITLKYVCPVMGEERNSLLVPSFSSTLEVIKEVLEKHEEDFIKNKITIELDSIIPRCLINFKYNEDILKIGDEPSYVLDEYINGTSKYIEKCGNCEYRSSCSGILKDYLETFGASEFEKGELIENNSSLKYTEDSLQTLLTTYIDDGHWIDYELLDKDNLNLEYFFRIPSIIMDYKLKGVYIKKGEIESVIFENSKIDDTLIMNVSRSEGKVYFSFGKGEKRFEKGNKKYEKIYSLIKLILYKKVNKNEK